MYEKSISYIPFILVGLLIAVLSWIGKLFDLHEDAEQAIQVGLWISETAGLFMLLRCGSFLKSAAGKITIVVVSIGGIGALFTIMHWPYGRLILPLALIIIPIIYITHFLRKPQRMRLDYLKLIWGILLFGSILIQFNHLWSGNLQVISSALMWLCIIDFMKTNQILIQYLNNR